MSCFPRKKRGVILLIMGVILLAIAGVLALVGNDETVALLLGMVVNVSKALGILLVPFVISMVAVGSRND